jgi:hypothetical protein
MCRSIGFLSFLPADELPALIKKRSRILGMPLFLLGACVAAYMFTIYFGVSLKYDGNTGVTTVAGLIMVVELLVLAAVYLMMVYHACKNNDVFDGDDSSP